jgi:hypothetical protein
MILVGLSGYAGCGKDTAAMALEPLGFKRLAFADTLRACLYALDPVIYIDVAKRKIRLQTLVDESGWDHVKREYEEARTLLQKLGTEMGRNILGENIWVETTLAALDDHGKYVVTDCRFENEAKAIKNRGGRMFRITRGSVGPANSHISEIGLDAWQDWDGHLQNNGTLEEYTQEVRNVLNEIAN